MRYRVAFEHPGQLFDLRELLQDAADAAAATAGITFLNPPRPATLDDLQKFVTVELNLPEDFLDQLMSILFLDGLPLLPLTYQFLQMDIPFSIKAPEFFACPLSGALNWTAYTGRIDKIVDAEDLVVVRDKPDNTYANEVDTFSGLENLIHFLRNKV